MKGILKTQEINSTTRFYFENKIGLREMKRLIEEFFSAEEIEQGFKSAKFGFSKYIDISSACSVEITNQYISFFPIINNSLEKESLKEKIYKIVALKSSVYYSSAFENINLVYGLILSENLRSSANLLYYSLHKLYSGELYNYLNTEVELYDEEINIAEIRHFGSRIYRRTFPDLDTVETNLNKENYSSVLGEHINPYILTRVIFSGNYINKIKEEKSSKSSYEKLNQNLNLFLCYYLNKKWSFVVNENPTIETLQAHLSSDNNEADKEIIRAAIKYFQTDEEEKSNVYLLDILAIRLYWLRQTADYDYDFEVQTSIRELSIITSCMESLFELFKIDKNYQLNKDKNQRNKGKIIETTGEVTQKNEVIEKNNIRTFFADVQFSNLIKYERNKEIIFISAVHLEANFNFFEINKVMNLMICIENKGKYYKLKSLIENQPKEDCYLHISKDGRWYIWIENPLEIYESEEYLKENFKLFIGKLYDNYNIYFKNKEHFNIISSSIRKNKKNEEKSIAKTLLSRNLAIKSQMNYIETSVCEYFQINFKHLATIKNDNKIELGDIVIEFKFDFSFNHISVPNIPNLFSPIYNNKNMYTFNLLLNTFPELLENESKIIEIMTNNTLGNIYNRLGIEDSNYFIKNYVFDVLELENLLNKKEFNEKLLDQFYSFLNTIIYSNLRSNELNNIQKDILEIIVANIEIDNYYYATLGMWYLRNKGIAPSESLKKGTEYYEIAIKKVPKYKKLIEDNYLIELFYFFERCGYYDKAFTELEKIIYLNEKSELKADLPKDFHEISESIKNINLELNQFDLSDSNV